MTREGLALEFALEDSLDRITYKHTHYDRRLRQAVEDARRQGYPVLSRSSAPGGYRLAASMEEVEAFLHELDSRIESLAVTRAQLLKNAVRHLHLRQLELLPR